MSIKILGGLLKGHPIHFKESEGLRPTTVMLRRKLFDAFQNLSGYSFVDLCAGSGAMGIEAWSRGANEVYLIEKNPKAKSAVKKTIQNLKESFAEQIGQRPIFLECQDCLKFLKANELLKSSNSILFLDPPYHDESLYLSVFKLLEEESYVGTLWFEFDLKQLKGWKGLVRGRAHKVYKSSGRQIVVVEY